MSLDAAIVRLLVFGEIFPPLPDVKTQYIPVAERRIF